MKTVPARGAADPERDAADKEPPTVLLGALKVKVPNGDTLVLQTTFDTGSDTDAISETVATKLRELGVAWGEAGGGGASEQGAGGVQRHPGQGGAGPAAVREVQLLPSELVITRLVPLAATATKVLPP